MKKPILTSVLAITIALLFAQQQQNTPAPDMPLDPETKLVTYSGVIEVPGVNQKDIYKRAEAWFNSFYKNPTEVIRERDTANCKIVGKPRFKIYNEALGQNVKTDAGLVQYTITIACKDNRFKYTLTEFNWKQASYFPIEKWIEQKDRFKQNGYYLYQTDSVAKRDVIPNFKNAITTVPKKIDRDNW